MLSEVSLKRILIWFLQDRSQMATRIHHIDAVVFRDLKTKIEDYGILVF